MLQAIEEQTAVRQTGESVMKRIVLELFFRSFAFGDVAIHDHQLADFAIHVADGAGDRLQNPPGPVSVADAVIQFLPDSGGARLACRLQYLETILGMDLIERRSFPQFGRRVTEDPLVGGIVVEAMSFHVDQRDHVGGIFGNDSEQFFALPELPMSAICAELLVEREKRQCANSDPIPLRHGLMRRLWFELVFELVFQLSLAKISAIAGSEVSRLCAPMHTFVLPGQPPLRNVSDWFHTNISDVMCIMLLVRHLLS